MLTAFEYILVLLGQSCEVSGQTKVLLIASGEKWLFQSALNIHEILILAHPDVGIVGFNEV